ncbi:hypothetical protein DL768_009881 [Monosporascus sp. mg162]|nr:hypothetical protein DL768_009881 [Monosporascus sp. mg162]
MAPKKAPVSKRLAAAKTALKNKRKGRQQTVVLEAENPEESEIEVATDTEGDTGSPPEATDNEPSEDEVIPTEPSEATSEAASEAASEAIPEAVPEAVPEAAPEDEAIRNESSRVAPEAATAEDENRFEIYRS